MGKIHGQIKLSRFSLRDMLAINLFLSIRHYQHPEFVTSFSKMGATLENNTLFGELGEHGEFLIPSIRDEELLYTKDCFFISPAYPKYTDNVTIWGEKIEELEKIYCSDDIHRFSAQYSKPAGACPMLWLDYQVVSPQEDEYSYLIWDQSEKTFHPVFALRYLAHVMNQMGYHMLEGTMVCDNDNGFCSVITVKDDVVSESITTDYCGSIGMATIFCDKLYPKKAFIGLIDKDYLRNTEVFTGKDIFDPGDVYDDACWTEKELIGCLDVCYAHDAASACKIFAKHHCLPTDGIRAIPISELERSDHFENS